MRRVVNAVPWELAQTLGSRRQSLALAPSFDDIVASIRSTMNIRCQHEQLCCQDPSFFRAVYCLEIDKSLFDLFFNSSQGYRAWYYRSPWSGLEANAAFLTSVRPSLLASGPIANTPHIDASVSLDRGSAKVWLAEASKGLASSSGTPCEHCAGEWSAPGGEFAAEILNQRWEYVHHTSARWGTRAPYLTKLRVFGAFVNHAGHELVPVDKNRRHFDIHERGWA